MSAMGSLCRSKRMCMYGCGAEAEGGRNGLSMLLCKNCGQILLEDIASRAAFTQARRERRAAGRIHPVRTVAETKWRAHVAASTKKAVELGFLPDPSSCICVDCGKVAACYDHRDYSMPLDVEPVCIACNSHRHRGKMPATKDPRDFALTDRGLEMLELLKIKHDRRAA